MDESSALNHHAASQHPTAPYCTATVMPVCVLTAAAPVPTVITIGTAGPDGAFAGICTFTCVAPVTIPGDVPA